MFSKSCEYGIKAVLFIAYKSQRKERVGLKAIAKEINSPEAFTAKIMQQLSRAKVIDSIKGPKGGFEMSDSMRQTTRIIDIVRVIDGNGLYENCGLGLDNCNDHNPCPIHSQYLHIRNDLIKMHSGASVDELARKLDEKATLK